MLSTVVRARCYCNDIAIRHLGKAPNHNLMRANNLGESIKLQKLINPVRSKLHYILGALRIAHCVGLHSYYGIVRVRPEQVYNHLLFRSRDFLGDFKWPLQVIDFIHFCD